MATKVSMTVCGESFADLAQNMVALGTELNSLGANNIEERSEISVEKLKGKRGRPAKVKPDEELEEEETENEESEDDEVESDEGEESEDETEEESEEDESEGLSEKDLGKLKGALKAYSAKNGKEKAVKLLNKFAKTSQEVEPSDLPKLLKLLKV